MPVQPQRWITSDDYPAQAMREGLAGAVSVVMAVDAGGKPVSCEGTGAAALLNDTTCRLLMARATFQPARDATGKPTEATFRSRFQWNLPRESFRPFAFAYRITIGAGGSMPRCEVWMTGDATSALRPCPNANDPLAHALARSYPKPGVLLYISEDRIDGKPPAAEGFKSDLPPAWSSAERMTIEADGRVSQCRFIDSSKPAATCRTERLFEAEPGRAPFTLLRTASAAFQPNK